VTVGPAAIEPFASVLRRHGLELTRGETTILQVNVGRLCNQACRHCHLEAGPGRPEVMGPETMDRVVRFAARAGFSAIDVTGGAPEMVPGILDLLSALRPHTPRLILRSNLTALRERGPEFWGRLRDLDVVIVTSFPSVSRSQTDAQRGAGVWEQSLDMLRRLNELGYGVEGTGLELDLVSNPAGAFLPPDQCRAEERFRRDLARRWGIAFSHLYTFANVPLGRYRRWLEESGNLAGYLEKLAQAFNPATVGGLMCRTQLSVAWDGVLYDCDFHLAAGLPLGGRPRHVWECEGPPPAGTPIVAADHCYACTAGSGFT